jgi:hypothetical protein
MGINASTRKPPVNITENGDKPVGIAYLDKGFLVITDPDIVSGFSFQEHLVVLQVTHMVHKVKVLTLE